MKAQRTIKIVASKFDKLSDFSGHAIDDFELDLTQVKMTKNAQIMLTRKVANQLKKTDKKRKAAK